MMSNDAEFTRRVLTGGKRPETVARREAKLEEFQQVIAQAAAEFVAASPFRSDLRDARAAIERLAAQFRRMALKNPKLYACTPESVGQAIGFCVTTGLLPGGVKAQVDLIPRNATVKVDGKDQKVLELNTQVSWRGYVALAARAGRRVKAVPVFDGEPFVHIEGLDEELTHQPDPDEKGYWTWDALRAVYVVVRDAKNPVDRDFIVLYRKGIQRRRGLAQSTKFWDNWPVEMSLKTGIRYAYDRGMLQLDEVGEWAMSEESGGTLELAPERPRVAAMPETAGALPDSDPLGFDSDDFDGVEDEREPVPAQAQEAERVDPGVKQQEPVPSEMRETRVPSYTAQSDAEGLRHELGDWKLPLTDEAVLDALKRSLNAKRLTPASRLQAAVDYGIATWGWRIVNDRLLPAREPGEEG
jgi:recombinational DNA repair protein RecT